MAATMMRVPPRYVGRAVTREEYLDLDVDPGYRYDMIEGVLALSPSTSSEHNGIIAELIAILAALPGWRVEFRAYPETDVLLADGGDVLRPDLSILTRDRLPLVTKHIHGAPAIVVEVLSDSNRARDLGVKSARYLSNGVQEYWVVDPAARSVEIRRNRGAEGWEVALGAQVESEVLPGAVLAAERVFG